MFVVFFAVGGLLLFFGLGSATVADTVFQQLAGGQMTTLGTILIVAGVFDAWAWAYHYRLKSINRRLETMPRELADALLDAMDERAEQRRQQQSQPPHR